MENWEIEKVLNELTYNNPLCKISHRVVKDNREIMIFTIDYVYIVINSVDTH